MTSPQQATTSAIREALRVSMMTPTPSRDKAWHEMMLAEVPDKSVWWSPNFATENDAALCHGMIQVLLHGAVRRPWPGDVPLVPAKRPQALRGGSIFERLRQIDLAEWAGRYTQIREVGPGKWLGKCPLHEERTPSFRVYNNPWRWHCFGRCGRGGDLASLAYELEQAGKR